MSAGFVTRALEKHVQTLCESELRRLERKFRSLSASDRATAEAIVADVIAAVVVMPVRALAADCPRGTLETVARLFDLEVSPNS